MTDIPSTLQTNPKPQSLLRRRWPTLAGLGFAALVAFDLASGVADLGRSGPMGASE